MHPFIPGAAELEARKLSYTVVVHMYPELGGIGGAAIVEINIQAAPKIGGIVEREDAITIRGVLRRIHPEADGKRLQVGQHGTGAVKYIIVAAAYFQRLSFFAGS